MSQCDVNGNNQSVSVIHFYCTFIFICFVLTLSILPLKFPNAQISVVIASAIDGGPHDAAIVVSRVVDTGVRPVKTTAIGVPVLGLRLSLGLPLAITIGTVAHATIDGGPHNAAIAVAGIVDTGVGPVETAVVAIATIVLGLRLSLSLPLAITIGTVAHATIDGGPHIAVTSVVQAGVGPVETAAVTIAAIVLGLRLSLRLGLSLPLAITISTVAQATIDGGPHKVAIAVAGVVQPRVETAAIRVPELGLGNSGGDHKDEGKLKS